MWYVYIYKAFLIDYELYSKHSMNVNSQINKDLRVFLLKKMQWELKTLIMFTGKIKQGFTGVLHMEVVIQ